MIPATSGPGIGGGWDRLAPALRGAFPVEAVDRIWVFRVVRRDGQDFGTAILSQIEGDRRRIFTASFIHTVKGKKRGQFEWALAEVGSGPLEALDELLALVPKRSDEEEPPEEVDRLAWFPPESDAAPELDDAAALLERFRRHLRERRLPITRQRLAVADALFGAEDHPSIEELQRRVRGAGHSIGTATLYRTVDVLVKAGMVLEHDFGEGFKRYEPLAAAAAHDHLICERCGRVVEVANERMERMLRMMADERRFLYRRHRVEVHGICSVCRGRDLEPLVSPAVTR